MRVDFYQLSRDSVEKVVALLAGKVLASGAKALVVAEADRLETFSRALWEADGFLANGRADAPDAERQPVLLASEPVAANGADIAILADGNWREEASGFSRALLLFGPEQTDAARQLWRDLGDREGLERHIFKQTESGGWREGG